jgi:Ca-activated chloride channel family protein
MAEGFQLLRPWWLLALLPLLVLGGLLLRSDRDGSRWRGVVDADLLPHLLERRDRSLAGWARPHWPWLPALALAVVALSGPTWQKLPQPTFARGDGLVIVLDLSLSMYAEDVAPSRIVRARHEISDILALRRDAPTGLVVYAGTAHAVTPLTDDTRNIDNLLAALEPGIMPTPGSDLAAALRLASELFERAGMERGSILVITDEVIDTDATADAFDARFPVSLLGIGTATGAPIPLAFAGRGGARLTDAAGVPVMARVDADRLGLVASRGGGRFRMAEPSTADTTSLLADSLRPALDARPLASTFDTWLDQGAWLLPLLLPFALAAFRRGAVPVFAACLLLGGAGRAEALDWRDLVQRRDQQGMQALRDGDAATAAERFADPAWRASALYRAERDADAAALWTHQPGADAAYNLGNALARQGRLDAAIDAYDRALAAEPGHADATHNRALLAQMRQQQQEAGGAPQHAQSGQPEEPGQQADAGQPGAPDAGSPTPGSAADGSGGSTPATTQAGPPADDGTGAAGAPEATAPTTSPSTAGPDDHRSATGRAETPTDGSDRVPSGTAGQATDAATADTTAGIDSREREQATEQWLRRVPDDPGLLLRRKFLSQSRDQLQRLRRGSGQPW